MGLIDRQRHYQKWKIYEIIRYGAKSLSSGQIRFQSWYRLLGMKQWSTTSIFRLTNWWNWKAHTIFSKKKDRMMIRLKIAHFNFKYWVVSENMIRKFLKMRLCTAQSSWKVSSLLRLKSGDKNRHKPIWAGLLKTEISFFRQMILGQLIVT